MNFMIPAGGDDACHAGVTATGVLSSLKIGSEVLPMLNIIESPSCHVVCAVIVTYNSGPGLVSNVRMISSQVRHIILVDNGSGEVGGRHVADAATAVPNAQVLLMGGNQGIAAALNAGIASAHHQGFHWVVTLDQDSTPEPDMVQRLLATLVATGDACVAVIGPTLLDAHARTQLQKPVPPVDDGRDVMQPLTLMTSGCLTSVFCWQEIGGFREDLFIDYVDHEYCLRCTSHGWQLRQSDAILNHRLGAMRTHHLFGYLRFNVTHHSVRRRYYITRNRLLIWRIYGARYPRWVLSDVRAAVIELAKIVLVERAKLRKLVAIGLGLRDGFCRHAGERNYRVFSEE